MSEQSFVLKGDFCWSRDKDTVETRKNGFLVCVGGVSAGVFPVLPKEYEALPLFDYSDKLITPGLSDLHVHAPQYAFRGLGMDLELLEWLDTNVFPEESKYSNLDYAKSAYSHFVEDMRKGPNTRAAVFATVHPDATELLMDLFEASGLCTMVGKVNMDRNSPDSLREKNAEASEKATLSWLTRIAGKYKNTLPILTPRFIPSCSDDLMERLGKLQRAKGLPVQSHLSENMGEVAWVHELCPDAKFYGDAYNAFGLFGSGGKTIMAHCVLSEKPEREMMKKQGVYVAHCPQSNVNLSSGVSPIRSFLDEGVNVGLGSDVAGGTVLSLFRAMADAIGASKMRWRLQDQKLKPLTASEAFYLGTLGGGSFFGKVGSFEAGYELDAIVLDDQRLTGPHDLTLQERLERVIYMSEDHDVVHKFVRGTQLF
ncbi:MAG: amidohydrolase family protein [Oscillospiraceae bacterium]